jgi:type IV pilus assembly protein PilB
MAAPVAASSGERLGELLIREGLITREALEQALQEQKNTGMRVGYNLVKMGFINEVELTRMLARQFRMPAVDLSNFEVDTRIAKLIPPDLAQRHLLLPLKREGRTLTVAMADPSNLVVIDDLKFITRYDIFPVIAGEYTLRNAIEKHYGEAADAALQSILEDIDNDDNIEVVEEKDEEISAATLAAAIDDAPVVKLINGILTDAVRRGASDIHFECFENEMRVRYRIDGALMEIMKPPMKLKAALVSRFKIMANLNIAERRVPQDGRIKLNLSKSKSIDFRVSTCPTLFGEKIVLRILDGSAARLGIDKLGYEEDQKELFVNAIDKPYGMVLVTGPTGSGKTVSLYTALNILNTEGRNISTVEDPVEIRVPGINQVQMNVKRGMTFAAALRSFLRQDPDVIMVGEIRDLETAEIAIKAAQTGHMVLSTLHTNDAPQTIARLMNMGIAPYNITSSVTLVIAQRLARRLHDCKKPLQLPPAALLAEGFSQQDIDGGMQIFDAIGCSGCNEGYKGRTGIYQVMPMGEDIQKIILAGGSALQIADRAQESGIRDLRASALIKVKNGILSLAEINRVTKD